VRILKAGEEPVPSGPSAIVGTPAAARESLKRLAGAGVDYFVSVPIVKDRDDFAAQVNRFAEVAASLSV
jgi:alkanesulfonate monooxygenase SsuD/methylene tetrahydromethanopterin reductase-like flavin-dependent oxidoreductase (luciferase family)